MQGRSPITPPPLVHARFVVLSEPSVQIGLEGDQIGVNLLPQGNPRELIAHGLGKPLHDSVGLGTLDLGAGMIDIFHRHIQLILMGVRTGAILRAPIWQNPAQRDFMGLKERADLVIEQLGGCQRRLVVIELGQAHLGVGINEGLLVNPPDALQRADVERILGPTLAWTFTLELPRGFFLPLRLL